MHRVEHFMTRSSGFRSPTLAIAAFSTSTYSETFVHQHIKLLPFRKVVLTGIDLTVNQDGASLVHRSLPGRAIHRVQKEFGLFDFERFRIQRVTKFFEEEKVGVVLAEFGIAATKVLAACELAGVPLIAHFHGLDAYVSDVLNDNKLAYRNLFQKAAAIVAVSHDMAARLEHLGAPRAKLHYIPYYVDPAIFGATRPEQNPPVFLAIGRFVEKKAPQLTLLAFAKVIEVIPTATMQFAGDGPLLGPTKQLARALGLDNAVTFLGSLPHSQIAERMKKARCFVQHSITAENGDAEGTPVAILEAQASGIPVVATRHMGIKDVVDEGRTGYLVNECDVIGMSTHMIEMARNAELAGRLGEAAARRIRECFGWNQTMGKLVQVIESASRGQL